MHDGHLFFIGSFIPLAGAFASGFFYFTDPYRFYDKTECTTITPIDPGLGCNSTAICPAINSSYIVACSSGPSVDIWYNPDDLEEYTLNYDEKERTISLSLLIIFCCLTGLVWRAACKADFNLPPFCRKFTSLLLRRRL